MVGLNDIFRFVGLLQEGKDFLGKVRGLARAVRCCAPPSTNPRPIGTLLPGAPVFQPPPSPSRRAVSPAGLSQPSSAIREGPSIPRKLSSHSSLSGLRAAVSNELHRPVDVAERLDVGQSCRRALGRLAPVRQRTVNHVCFRIVVRQQFGLGLGNFGKPACETLPRCVRATRASSRSRPTERPRRGSAHA